MLYKFTTALWSSRLTDLHVHGRDPLYFGLSCIWESWQILFHWPDRTNDPKCLDNKKPPPGIVPSDINEPSKCFHFILYQPCRYKNISQLKMPFCILLFFFHVSLSVRITRYTQEKSCMMCSSSTWTMEICILYPFAYEHSSA